jgi:hypothetical protein
MRWTKKRRPSTSEAPSWNVLLLERRVDDVVPDRHRADVGGFSLILIKILVGQRLARHLSERVAGALPAPAQIKILNRDDGPQSQAGHPEFFVLQ